MATMAPVRNKNEQADALRNEAAALEKELSKLRADLSQAQSALGVHEDRQRELAEAAADGRPPKPSAVAELHARLREAELPIAPLQKRVSEKQGRLDVVREELFFLDREIALEEAAVARQARFAELTKQGNAAADTVAADIRKLLEVSFPALDAVRDALIREFIGGQFSTGLGDEPRAARAVLHSLLAKISDGEQVTVAERELLRTSDSALPWTVRGDIVFTVRNLKPPRKP